METVEYLVNNQYFEYLQHLEQLDLLEYLEYIPSIDGALNNIVAFLSLFLVVGVCYGCYKLINIFF